ncbi:hypothetical protein [Haloglycomyces albus]|uniref:hypothetical protein n=1 Tax=Haloglycomyces albus TaxID=526067 RepID=UPI00046D1C59|nr:hypothetical protein [Haloglycomyces albus]
MTDNPQRYRELAAALARLEHEYDWELTEKLPPEQAGRFAAYIAALFAVMLEDHFSDGISRDGIASFVNEMRHDHATAEPSFPSLLAEGVIRGMAGESHFLEEISDRDILSLQVLVIQKLASRAGGVRPDLKRFLEEADHLMGEWSFES